MSEKKAKSEQRSEQSIREDRLKAALKANLARRKAQTRARSAADADAGTGTGNENEQDKG